MSKYRVLSMIADERERQDAKWGQQNHPDGTSPFVDWMNPDTPYHISSATRVADQMRLSCDTAASEGRLTWRDILLEEVAEAFAESDEAALTTELVQTAAVIVAWVEAIHRRNGLDNGATDK